MVGLPWGQLYGLLHFLNLFIISSWASLVILVFALTLILQLINFARLSLNLASVKSFPLFNISSNILFTISSSWPFGTHVGWDITRYEFIPNSSIVKFNSFSMSIFSFILIYSLFGIVITMGTKGDITLLLGCDSK